MKISTAVMKVYIIILTGILLVSLGQALLTPRHNVIPTNSVVPDSQTTANGYRVRLITWQLGADCKRHPHKDGDSCPVFVTRVLCTGIPSPQQPREICWMENEIVPGRYNATTGRFTAFISGVGSVEIDPRR